MSYQNENVRSFERAEQVLGPRESKIIGLNTRIARNPDGSIGITLHSTELVRFQPDKVTMEVTTGGWNTVTTRERLNRYLPAGLRVWTEKGVLYIGKHTEQGTEKMLFVDGGIIRGDQLIDFPAVNGKAKEVDKVRRKVAKFAKDYIEAMKAGKVEAPGAGDCFYCGMRVVEPEKDKGRTLGEVGSGADHIDSHIAERYFVPSLLARAVEVFPVSQVANWCIGAMWASDVTDEQKTEASKGGGFYDIGWDQLTKALRRYILRQYGIDGR